MAGIHSDRLRAAKALISKPEAWTKGVEARNAQGKQVPVDHPTAVCFCGYGALHRVAPDQTESQLQSFLYLQNLTPDGFFALWQDSTERAHQQVMDLFDRAIAQAESEGL